jgi:hypothetical protein
MANKSTRQLRKEIRAAGKRGEKTVEHRKPRHDYHNIPNDDYRTKPDSCFVKQSFPTAIPNSDGVVSSNRKRNSCMRVLLNKAESGRTASLTVHEPHLRHEPMDFPNHREYANWEYRRKPAGQVSA